MSKLIFELHQVVEICENLCARVCMCVLIDMSKLDFGRHQSGLKDF